MLIMTMALFLHTGAMAAVHPSLPSQWKDDLSSMYRAAIGKFEEAMENSASGVRYLLSIFFSPEDDSSQDTTAFIEASVAVDAIPMEQISLPSLHSDLATIAAAAQNLIFEGEQNFHKYTEFAVLVPPEDLGQEASVPSLPFQFFTLQESDAYRSIGNIAEPYGQNSGWKGNSFSDSDWNRQKNYIANPGRSLRTDAPTPEPGTLVLLCIGAAALVVVRKLRSA